MADFENTVLNNVKELEVIDPEMQLEALLQQFGLNQFDAFQAHLGVFVRGLKPGGTPRQARYQ